MLKTSNDEIWYFHTHCEKQLASGLGIKNYAVEAGIDYKKFSNFRYRIVYKKYSDPKTYSKYVDLYDKYTKSGATVTAFSKEHGIRKRLLDEMITHKKYLSQIEYISLQSKEAIETTNTREPAMNFVQIAAQPQEVQPPMEAEVLEQRNDIEIIISKGVKVSISPNIESLKIIKIIELLKDL